MEAPDRLQARISQLESEVAKCRAQSEAQAIEVEAAAQALERQYLAQDAALRQIERERQDAVAEAAATMQELRKEREAKTSVERELAAKASELEDVQLKSQLLKEQRVSLLDQLEQRKLEQQELKASLDSYVSKTTTLLEEKLQAERRADEAQLERMRSHGEHTKLHQRIAHLEEQVSFLEKENEAKSGRLLEAQRKAAEEQLDSRRQVAELQGQLESKTAQETYLNSLLESKQQLLDQAQAARAESERAAAAEKLLLEGQLAAEKEAGAALKELYEVGRERAKTLEETLLQLQTQIEESSAAHAEALQKSEEAREAAEELAEKRREQLEQMAVTIPQAPPESPGPSPVTPAPALPPSRPRTSLRPDPELQVVPLHDGLTVQDLYSEYTEMACAYQSEAAKCRQLQNYMDSVCEQLEGRAKVMQRQQDTYNRAVQERAQLAASVQTLQDERRMLEAKTAQAVSQLEGALRRTVALEQQNADVCRQVEVLLAEMERLHGRPVPAVPPVPRKNPGVISAEDVINDKLVAFTNLPELLDQHKQMRAMIRSLVDELETTRSSAREEASRIVAERQAQLDAAIAGVAADRQRLRESWEAAAAQQDHYKQALATATAEIEKLRGNPGAAEANGERVSPARLALEGPVEGEAGRKLEELRQQLESAKQSSAQEIGNLRQQLAEGQVKFAEVKAELAAATAAQQHAEARIQDLQAHMEVLKQQRGENLQERQRLQQSVNLAEQRLRAAQASVEEKGEELARARSKIAELEQDVARERRAESEASQKLVKLHMDSRNEASELRYQLGLAAARQESLSREAKEAKEKVIALEAEVGRLNSELLQEKSKLSSLKESDVLRIQSSFGLVKQYKEENSTMKGQVEEYKSKVKAQESEREELQKAHGRLQQKVGLLEQELQESKDKMCAMTSEHTQVVKGQQEELEQLRLEIKSKQEVADLGKKQLEAARQEVTFYQLAANTAGADAATLKGELEARTAELADVRNRLEATQKSQTEVQQALDKLKQETQVHVGKLQEELSNLKLQHQSTQQELGSRNGELREIKQQLEFTEASHKLDKEALQQAQEKLTTAERQIDDLAAALEAVRKQRDVLQDKVTLSEKAHTSEVQSLRQTLQDLQLQAATYRLQSEKMTQDVMTNVTDETVLQTVEFLKQQQNSAEERLQQLQDERERLTLERDAAVREATEARAQVRNLEELSQRSISPKVHRQQLDEVEGKVRQLREEVISLKAQLQDAETRQAAVSTVGESKEAELEALQQQVSTLQSSLTEAEEKLQVHEELSKQWGVRIQQLREQNNCVEKSEFDKLQQELEKAKKQLTTAESRKINPIVNRLQKQLAEIRSKHTAELNEQKAAGNKKYNEIVRKYNSTTKANGQLRKELEETKASLTALQQQLTQQEQEVAERLASRAKELDELRSSEVTLRSQLQAREELQSHMSSRMEAVRKQIDQALTDSVNKQREIERLQRDVNKLRKDVDDLQKERTQLVEQTSTLKGEKQALLQQLQARSTTPPQQAPNPAGAAALSLPTATQTQPSQLTRTLPPSSTHPHGPTHTRIPTPAPISHTAAPSAQLPAASSQLPTARLPSVVPVTPVAAPAIQTSATPPTASAPEVPSQKPTPHTPPSTPPAATAPSTTPSAQAKEGPIPAPAAQPKEAPTTTPAAAASTTPPTTETSNGALTQGAATTATPAAAVVPAPVTAMPAVTAPAASTTTTPAVEPSGGTVLATTTTPAPSTTTTTPPPAGIRPPPAVAADKPKPSTAVPTASSDTSLPPTKDPMNMLALLKARMAQRVKNSADGVAARQPGGTTLAALSTGTQQPSPATKRARIESTDTTAEGGEVADKEGEREAADVAAGITSPPVAKRQRGADGQVAEAGDLTPNKGARGPSAAQGVAAASPTGAGAITKLDGGATRGTTAQAPGDTEMKPVDDADAAGDDAVRQLFTPAGTAGVGQPSVADSAPAQAAGQQVVNQAGAESAPAQPDKGTGTGDIVMEEGKGDKQQDRGLSRVPSEVQLKSEVEEVIEIEDTGMEDVQEADELEEDGQSHPAQAVQGEVQHDSAAPHEPAPSAQGLIHADKPVADQIQPPPLSTATPPAATTDTPATQPAEAPAVIRNAVQHADVALQGNATLHHPGTPHTVDDPSEIHATDTPKSCEDQEQNVSEQSLQRFGALHYITLQMDAKNVSEHNEHELLLGSIPENMPRYDKPLMYLTNDRANEAGMSLPDGVAQPDAQPSQSQEVSPVAAAGVMNATAGQPAGEPQPTAEGSTIVPPQTTGGTIATAEDVTLIASAVATTVATAVEGVAAASREGVDGIAASGPGLSLLSPNAVPFVPVAPTVASPEHDDATVDTEVVEHEEEHAPASPSDLHPEGDETGGEIEVMDLVDDDDDDEEGGAEEEGDELVADEEDGEMEMEEADDQADDNGDGEGEDMEDEDGDEGVEDGEVMDDDDEVPDDDTHAHDPEEGSAMLPPVALSRANTSQVEVVNQPAPGTSEAHTPPRTQDSTAHHGGPQGTTSLSPAFQGSRTSGPLGSGPHEAAGGMTTGAMRTSSAVSPAPSGTGPAGGGNNEDDGGADGGDDTEHSSRDPGARRPRRAIQFQLAPRTDTGPPAVPGPPGDPVQRPHPNIPIHGRGQLGHPALRGGLMGRGRRGRMPRGRGGHGRMGPS